MEPNQQVVLNSKPLRIKVLQWIFLVITMLVLFSLIQNLLRGAILPLTPVKNGYDAMVNLLYYILCLSPMIITISLFLYRKSVMLFITPLLIIDALIVILSLQFLMLNIILGLWGVSLTDFLKIVSPQIIEKLKGSDANQIVITFGLLSMCGTFLIYGIPLLAVLILHKLTSYKEL